MLKWLLGIGFVFAFVLLPQVRYTCFHLPLVFYNAVIDTYKYFKLSGTMSIGSSARCRYMLLTINSRSDLENPIYR